MPKLRWYPQQQFTFCVNPKEHSSKWKWLKFTNNVEQESYIKNRVNRIISKEPETINWLKTFKKNSIFFDVGANIGIYALYSAKIIENKVYAFEPHAANYINLLDNISRNKLHNIQAFPVAIGKNNVNLTTLAVPNMLEGVSDNVVGSSKEYYHGCVEFSLDYLVSKKLLPQPDHIKIDVDGYEDKVVDGAKNTLSQCESILIEVDTEQHDKIKSTIIEMGFREKDSIKMNKHEESQLFNLFFIKDKK